MDFSDRATELEEMDRANAIRNSTRPTESAIVKKRKKLIDAQEIAGQRALTIDEIVELSVTCENCDDPLSLSSTDVFCCKDCADDWSRRDRAQRRAGR